MTGPDGAHRSCCAAFHCPQPRGLLMQRLTLSLCMARGHLRCSVAVKLSVQSQHNGQDRRSKECVCSGTPRLQCYEKLQVFFPCCTFLLHQVACLYTDKRGKRLIRHILTCRRRSRRTESANSAGPRRSPHLAAAADIFAEQCLPIHGNRRRYQFAPKTGHVGQCSTWLPH